MKGKKSKWIEYNPGKIEAKWQKIWEEKSLFLTPDSNNKPKYYCLDFFPYPSGEGLHVGHCRNYIPTDLISRYKRMQGFAVLHPMGWDAFGEPTEQFAILHNAHPRVTTDRNTDNFRRQMKLIGTSYDWTKEIDSSKPEFYRWTQWFFLLFYRKGLAYRDKNWQWWCPVCNTTLSSNEIDGNKCWRGHEGITKKEIPAWYFKITEYADELIDDLEIIDWPEPVKTMQRNWIGRTEGANIRFSMDDGVDVDVFTTRPDTLFGATFLSLSIEHPLVERLTQPGYEADIEQYIDKVLKEVNTDQSERKPDITGVFTGSFIRNPINRELIPVWVADYVSPDFGTGAIMGVPAHDQKDWEFARKYGLEIRKVISFEGKIGKSNDDEVFTGQGLLINSSRFTGYKSDDAFFAITEWLRKRNRGSLSVSYRMHDWLISRQRYWGTPIPIIYCQECGEVPVPEDQLPVLLPEMENFAPDGTGRSPLARVSEFVNVTCPECGGPAERETDTLGGFACSSWYFLRFTSPEFANAPFDQEKVKYWMPVDLYVGGAEHAVLHLLYARFWTKVLADSGLILFREPFSKVLNQGQMMGIDGQRMSKSRGNVITPDAVVNRYGADALRVFELFMAPFDQNSNWTEEGINGAVRFINKIWTLFSDTYDLSAEFLDEDTEISSELHKTIKVATERIESFKLNTLISLLMEFGNKLVEFFQNDRWRNKSFHESLDVFLLLLAPVTPHLSEELWHITGHDSSVHNQKWPVWDEDRILSNELSIPIQVDGKLRTLILVTQDENEDELKRKAISNEKIKDYLGDKTVAQIIYVKGKVLNIVTSG